MAKVLSSIEISLLVLGLKSDSHPTFFTEHLTSPQSDSSINGPKMSPISKTLVVFFAEYTKVWAAGWVSFFLMWLEQSLDYLI
jgi:hypothetical protein